MTQKSAPVLDAQLAKDVRNAAKMRKIFYVAVLGTALAGQVSGAVEALHLNPWAAIPAVAALEIGGIVVLNNADVRRRLGERATASRVLAAAIAGGAVAFNWLAHENKLLAGFFAGMSALGYLVWVMHTENQRRDRLRATGDLPPTTPAYEVIGHWLRHPWITLRAQNLAKADEALALYTSIAAARAEKRREVRLKAIAKVLHRKIRAAVDPSTADIAVNVYDLDDVAERLAAGADYPALAAIIAADLHPARIAGVDVDDPMFQLTPVPTHPALTAGPDRLDELAGMVESLRGSVDGLTEQVGRFDIGEVADRAADQLERTYGLTPTQLTPSADVPPASPWSTSATPSAAEQAERRHAFERGEAQRRQEAREELERLALDADRAATVRVPAYQGPPAPRPQQFNPPAPPADLRGLPTHLARVAGVVDFAPHVNGHRPAGVAVVDRVDQADEVTPEPTPVPTQLTPASAPVPTQPEPTSTREETNPTQDDDDSTQDDGEPDHTGDTRPDDDEAYAAIIKWAPGRRFPARPLSAHQILTKVFAPAGWPKNTRKAEALAERYNKEHPLEQASE